MRRALPLTGDVLGRRRVSPDPDHAAYRIAGTTPRCEQRIRIVNGDFASATEAELAENISSGEYQLILWEYRDVPADIAPPELQVPAENANLWNTLAIASFCLP